MYFRKDPTAQKKKTNANALGDGETVRWDGGKRKA